MPLKPHEIALVAHVGFETEVADLFKTAMRSSLLPFNPTGEALAGIAGRVIDGQAAEAILKAVQPMLVQRGYRAFWTDLREASGLKIGYAVAMLRSTDHFAILDAAKPCAEGHAGPEVIRDKLKSYEHLCALEIVGAASDWVAVTFKSLPSDLCAFAEDVYLFCPDSCDLNSGIGSKQKNNKKEVRAAAMALCPNVSENFRNQHKAKYLASGVADSFPEDFYDMLIKDAEWSVRLLAKELDEKMYFFFWWD